MISKIIKEKSVLMIDTSKCEHEVIITEGKEKEIRRLWVVGEPLKEGEEGETLLFLNVEKTPLERVLRILPLYGIVIN